jgi:hypothetical protein
MMMRVVVADNTVRVERPAEAVFAFVSDPTNDVRWHENVLSARKVSEGPIGVGSRFEWDAKFLGRRKVELEVTRFEPPRLAETRLRSGWMRASVTYLVEPRDGDTDVTRSVGIPVPRIFRPLEPIVRRAALRSGHHHGDWLRAALEGKSAPQHENRH